jgi:hypothetical protein
MPSCYTWAVTFVVCQAVGTGTNTDDAGYITRHNGAAKIKIARNISAVLTSSPGSQSRNRG